MFLSLRGQSIANNSYVNINDIGEYEDALLCHSDKPGCCSGPPNRAGEWYYPNGTRVETMGRSDDEFYRDRGTQVVRLNHRPGSFTERGLFRCEVPDASNINQRIYMNIGNTFGLNSIISLATFLNSVHTGNLTVSPFDPATKITGEMFSLVCSADIHPLPTHGHVQLSIFEWFFDNSSLPSGATASDVIKSGTTTYTSTLKFSPLDETHTGVYTCQISYTAVSTTITVKGKN